MAEFIDREAAMGAVLGVAPDAHYPGWYASILMAVPAADVAPVVHSSWDLHMTVGGHEYTLCARCSTGFSCRLCDRGSFTKIDMRGTHYCPNCGAKMDGGDSDGR